MGNIPGRAQDQDLQCGWFRARGTAPQRRTGGRLGGGSGWNCVSLHAFLPAAGDRLTTEKKTLTLYRVSLIANKVYLLCTAQQTRASKLLESQILEHSHMVCKWAVIPKVCEDFHQGKEEEENKGNEVTFLAWIRLISVGVTFPQVALIFLSLIEPYC